MSVNTDPDLNGVAATLLAPLYWKAMESQHPDAMIKDDKAVALVKQMSLDFSPVRQIRMTELLQANKHLPLPAWKGRGRVRDVRRIERWPI